jgi:hypothetical protein
MHAYDDRACSSSMANEVPLLNAAYWKQRAEQARVTAESMHQSDARRLMLEMAQGYDRLAKMAEAREGDP